MLKATPLSWCAKWGLEPDVRLLLGHHSTGKQSAECYARDNLAKPLRDFDLALQQIRTRGCSPDATRSGMISDQIIQDPIWSFVSEKDHSASKEADVTDPDMNEPPSSSSSESSDSSDEASETDPVSQAREWDPDTIVYRNKTSLIVHVVAVGGAGSFSCGIRITAEYEKIQESHFLDIRRCKISRPRGSVGRTPFLTAQPDCRWWIESLLVHE